MKRVYHEREAGVTYSQRTDRQPVTYWATNHLLARLYFDSNTQEITKRHMYPSYISSFPPLHEKKFFNISLVFMRENDVTPSTVMEMKTDVTKQIKMTPR